MLFLFILKLLYHPPPKGEQKAARGGLIVSLTKNLQQKMEKMSADQICQRLKAIAEKEDHHVE